MLIELEPGVSFYACAVATLDQTTTLSHVCCVAIDCNLLAWTCMLLKFIVSLILSLDCLG